jgi:hypothetical protein
MAATLNIFILGAHPKARAVQAEKCVFNAGNGLKKIMPASFISVQFLSSRLQINVFAVNSSQ